MRIAEIFERIEAEQIKMRCGAEAANNDKHMFYMRSDLTVQRMRFSDRLEENIPSTVRLGFLDRVRTAWNSFSCPEDAEAIMTSAKNARRAAAKALRRDGGGPEEATRIIAEWLPPAS